MQAVHASNLHYFLWIHVWRVAFVLFVRSNTQVSFGGFGWRKLVLKNVVVT